MREKSQSGAGTFAFVKNSLTNETTGVPKSGETLKLPRSSTYPLPCEVVLADGIKIIDSTLPLLAAARNGQAVTVVVYGQPGGTGRITLSANGGVQGDPLGRCCFKNYTADLTDVKQAGFEK